MKVKPTLAPFLTRTSTIDFPIPRLPPVIKIFLLSNKDITIYGDGEQSRDMCYIDNIVYANIRADTSVQNLTGFGEAGSALFGEEGGEVQPGRRETLELGSFAAVNKVGSARDKRLFCAKDACAEGQSKG